MKKVIVLLMLMIFVIPAQLPLPSDQPKNAVAGAIGFVAGSIGSHLIGRGVDHVINNPPPLPPPSPVNDPSMPSDGGVIHGGRMGREF